MASGFQFEDLMSMAENNALKGEKKIKNSTAPQFNLTTKPKKVSSKDRKLSDGVKRFLQKREEEEKQKAKEERLKKEHLLQLRAQDKKANRRVNSMLKMTKSANKACMADAKDCLNDSLAEQGEYQPDEDDYGYESQHSQDMYRKIMDKYKQQPVSKPTMKPKGAPVPTAQTLAKYRQARTESNHDDSHTSRSPEFKEPVEVAPKKQKKVPEVLNFQAMMELANKNKSQETVAIPMTKLSSSKEKEVFEYGRPMTAKEKAAFLQENALKQKLLSMNGSLANEKQVIISDNRSGNAGVSSNNGNFKIPSLKKKESAPVPKVADDSKRIKNLPNHSAGRVSSQNIPPNASKRPNPAPSQSTNTNHRSSSQQGIRPTPQGPRSNSIPEKNRNGNRPVPAQESKSKVSPKADFNGKIQDRPKQLEMTSRVAEPKSLSLPPKSNPKPEIRAQPRDVERQRQRSPPRPDPRSRMSNPQQRPPPPRGRPQPPPPPYSRGPPPRSKPPMKSNKRRIESDDEDSEMDDFIDDDDEQVDYSSMIRQITGYDKNRYLHIDEDDIQESSVAEQWREEQYSAKIGMREDLEDMKLEAEEKKRKMLMKKKMRRS